MIFVDHARRAVYVRAEASNDDILTARAKAMLLGYSFEIYSNMIRGAA
jgi:hypothetical protein